MIVHESARVWALPKLRGAIQSLKNPNPVKPERRKYKNPIII
jgi:hypothetical protein